METIGEQPFIAVEVNIAKTKRSTPKSRATQTPGINWIPVKLGRSRGPMITNKPHINLYELAKTPNYSGGRFIHDDRAVSNIIYGFEKNLPPLRRKKSRALSRLSAPSCWLIMAGQIRYPIENQGVIIADEGDVVYAPIFTFHAPRFHGPGPSCRLAMNASLTSPHLRCQSALAWAQGPELQPKEVVF